MRYSARLGLCVEIVYNSGSEDCGITQAGIPIIARAPGVVAHFHSPIWFNRGCSGHQSRIGRGEGGRSVKRRRRSTAHLLGLREVTMSSIPLIACLYAFASSDGESPGTMRVAPPGEDWPICP